MSRKPARENYDAVLDFAPLKTVPSLAYVLLKQTFEIGEKRCALTAVEPLQHDIRDDKLEPRLPPGSDFWFQKLATDVVVQGSAFVPEGRAVQSMTASVRIGERTKSVRVFGERVLEWRHDGTPIIPSPEPFTEMPLTYANAYGGIDPRVQIEVPKSLEEFVAYDLFDFPGLYPRNFQGKGYLVKRAPPLPGVSLPNLENPQDLLTLERLIIDDPALWHHQPLPWCFDWTNPVMFPRMAYVGLTPRFPAPAIASLPEIALGLLPLDFALRYPPMGEVAGPPPEAFFQEASLGLTFKELRAGTPIVLEGMHPERPRLELALPAAPKIQIRMDGKELPALVTLTNCVIKPNEQRMSLVYCALVRDDDMPRVFIPEVHKHIPFEAVIDGDVPVRYEAPVPLLDRLEKRS